MQSGMSRDVPSGMQGPRHISLCGAWGEGGGAQPEPVEWREGDWQAAEASSAQWQPCMVAVVGPILH